jgi:hypothetical protein
MRNFEKKSIRMENHVQVIFFREENGAPAIRFEMNGQEKYALSFCGQHKAILHIPDKLHDKLLCFGQLMIISNALKIDFKLIEISPMRTCGLSAGFDSRIFPVMIEALQNLCGFVNSYFKDRAAFYWGILSSDCHVKDMFVCAHKYKIAYRQLIEIDAGLYHNTRNVA